MRNAARPSRIHASFPLAALLLLASGTALAAPRRTLTPEERRGPEPSAARASLRAAMEADRAAAAAKVAARPPRVALNAIPCVAGQAGPYPCRDIDLEAFLPNADVGGGATSSDVWGWTDPLTGKEYALYAASNGVAFVDLSDPASPVYVGILPTRTLNSFWRGVKVYRDHAYVVSEAADHGLQVFDLTRLRGVTAPPVIFSMDAFYSDFGTAHTIAINEESGFAYVAGSDTCAGGLHMIDIRDPVAPVFAGCFADDGYTHEAQCVIYRGPDTARVGREICFCANGDVLTLVDVTDHAAPVQISRTTYPQRGYVHQGWLTEDHAHFLLDDEFDEDRFSLNTTTHIWDMRSLAAPVRFSTFVSTTAAIDHNVYIVGRRAYESNYEAGLRILDIACVAAGELEEVGYFDTFPAEDDLGFNGSWSNYPYFASGVVAVSSIDEGLFIVRPRVATPAPDARPAPPPSACAGDAVTLDGSPSLACSAAGLRFRWLDGTAGACPWSTSPTCVVRPATTRDYTLEVECLDRPGCTASARVTVTVGAGVVPGSLGNTLRAVRAANDVRLLWGTDPDARTYALYRSIDRRSWPVAPFRTGLPAPSAVEPDVPGPPFLYTYRSVGVSCTGLEGP